MSDVYVVAVEGLANLGALDEVPKKTLMNAQRAINATAKHALSSARKDLYKRFSFPRGYLERKDRMWVSRYAKADNLEAAVTGRGDPTSLARFIVGGARLPSQGAPRTKGVAVEVLNGQQKNMPGAFVMKLRNANLGLAVRTSKAPSPWAKKLSENLWLLYGISVDQAFRHGRERIADGEEAYLEREFLRLMDLDL